MSPSIRALIKSDSIMFEYDVHNMKRAIQWYQDVFGFEITYGPYDCHTEFALPVAGARLALSLADDGTKIEKGARLFMSTPDIQAVETYLRNKGVKTRPIENVDNAVLILWVEDTEGNHLAFEQWLDRQHSVTS